MSREQEQQETALFHVEHTNFSICDGLPLFHVEHEGLTHELLSGGLGLRKALSHLCEALEQELYLPFRVMK
jgi:hypothetical protein